MASMNDLRFAIRQLVKNPGFTAVAVLTLALGIGANTIVFSWIRAVLFDAVPGARQADRLVVLCPRHTTGRIDDTMSVLDNRDLAAQTNIFAGVAGSAYDAASLRVGAAVDWVWQESATANFFDLLRVEPALGRFFLPDEDTHPGGDNVTVLSYGLWQRRFGGDRKILGRVIEISNRPFTVVGVAPADFSGGMGGLRFDLWIPASMTLAFTNTADAFSHRNWRFLHTYARLQPGVALAQAQVAASGVMRRLADEYADTNRDTGVAVLPVWKSPWGGQAVFLPLLRSLAVVAVLLLLLVAANIANLLLARATARQSELAVRLALGAGRVRLVRQLLVESVLLAGWGGGAGCLFATWGVSLMFKLMPATYLPIGYNVQLNSLVLFFCALITLVTGVLFGLAPAWQATKTNLHDTLKQSGRANAPARGAHWLRSALVVSEVALALVLLAGMTLCARSLERARKVDLGLDPRNVWVAGFRLPPVGYDQHRIHNIYRRLRQDLAGLPGVESVALADWLPLGFEGGSSSRFAVDGYQPAPGEPMSAGVSAVSPDYFRALRIPVLAGREFAERDDISAQRVVVINQFLATRYFAGRDPIGLKIHLWGDDWTIAGVARTGKYRALNEPAQAFVYVPLLQVASRSGGVMVRTIGDPSGIARSVERAAVAIDPLLKPVAALTMTDYTAAVFAIPRVAATLLTALGMVALLLAGLGIYGVIAYSVNQRTREIGIRMALGAQRLDVFRLFVGQGMKLACAGVVIGLVGTLAAAQVLSSLLIGISASDPLTYLAVASLLAAVAWLACWLPARRAARVDPMEALRCE
jgi:predicted permease